MTAIEPAVVDEASGTLVVLGDKLGLVRHAASTLAEDGSLLPVEPMAGGGSGLGTLATEDELRQVANADGPSRAAETPFNRIFEARR
jgi:hypothetical protein